jgi:hypothetical protein
MAELVHRLRQRCPFLPSGKGETKQRAQHDTLRTASGLLACEYSITPIFRHTMVSKEERAFG